MKFNDRVSIVIPVYNEAAYLPACLDAIAAQTVRPYEVIVVDNNSTDGSDEVASAYDFVTVRHQSRQGVVHARDAGFDAARGGIIGRIDADTVIDADWVATVQNIMRDASVSAVSGRAKYYDMALSPILNRIDLGIRRYLARVLGNEVAMQGANMAVRRSVWQAVRAHVCRRGGMHEDFDLTVHINRHGGTVIFDEQLVASLGYRQAESNFREFMTYVLLSPRTYARHGLTSHWLMYPVVALALIGYLPLKLLHRGYDAQSERFSWSSLLSATAKARVNPATYVD